MSEAAIDLEAALAAVTRQAEDDLILPAAGGSRLEFEYLRRLYPALIEYRGGLFVEATFDQVVVDDILQHSDEAEPIVAAQRHVNALDLSGSDEEPMDAFLAQANGEAIAFAWTHWIRERFGREIATHIDLDDVTGVVWFRARP